MSEPIHVEARLTLSKRFPPGTYRVRFGRYELLPMPSSGEVGGEAVLAFSTSYKHHIGGGSHPEEEANIVTKLLSVLLDMRAKKGAFRVNGIDILFPGSGARTAYPQFVGILDSSQLEEYLRKFLSLNIDLARQFTRSCNTYCFALDFIPQDATFAFFLLVVSVECMSSQDEVVPFSELDPDKKKCERFCRFINSFLPRHQKTEDEQNTELITELLKTVYYSHRSGFVHGGSEVSTAALMADHVKSSYFRHASEGKEIKTPGLGWFARIVRLSLLGYLDSANTGTSRVDEDLVSRLAMDKALLQIKPKKDIPPGAAVIFDDIDYR